MSQCQSHRRSCHQLQEDLSLSHYSPSKTTEQAQPVPYTLIAFSLDAGDLAKEDCTHLSSTRAQTIPIIVDLLTTFSEYLKIQFARILKFLLQAPVCGHADGENTEIIDPSLTAEACDPDGLFTPANTMTSGRYQCIDRGRTSRQLTIEIKRP